MKDVSPVSECPVAKDSIPKATSAASSTIPKKASVRRAVTEKKTKNPKELASATHASRVSTKKATSSAKSKSCKKPTHSIISSKTSDPASISKGKDLLPFWSKYTQELSKLWSFSTETDCVDTDLSWSNGSSQRLAQGSWFTVSCRKPIHPPLPPPLPMDPNQQLASLGLASEISAKNSPTTSSLSLPTLWRETMDDARQKTDAKESDLKKAQEKAFLRKQRMASAQQEKKRKRNDEKCQESTVDSHRKTPPGTEAPAVKKKKSRTTMRNSLSTSSMSSTKRTIEAHQDLSSNPTMKEPPCRVIRYKLYPTPGQMVLLRKAFGVTTWTYNQCLAAILDKKINRNISECRNYALNKKADLLKNKPWVIEVPYDIRDEAAQDLLRAYKAHDTKVANGDLHAAHATFKFQSKYRKSKKLVIQSKHYKSAGVFFTDYFGTTPFRCNETLPDSIQYAANLTINWLGQVHLHIPRPLEKRNIQPVAKTVAAIDPGVRTFGTVFDAEANQYIEWGKGNMSRLAQIALSMDKIKSRMDEGKGQSEDYYVLTPLGEESDTDEGGPTREDVGRAPAAPPILKKNIGHRKRYRLKRVFRRKSYRIQNMVKDFHYRFANWLCQNYKVILLPHYKVSQMAIKANRKINCKTVRGMLTWAPCLFRDRLMGVSRRYPDCHVVPLSEAYTTKTCRACGFLHSKIGGAKEFKCPSCHIRYGRDCGGASNILLRYLTLLNEDNKNELSCIA
jgi:putative transposase